MRILIYILPLFILSLTVHAAETITLPVKRTAYEKVWKAALVDKLRADKIGDVFDEQQLDEQQLAFGRADIVTEKEVYEIDRYDKFHQGIGQTLHYSMVLKKPAVLDVHQDRQGVAGLSWEGMRGDISLLHHPTRMPRILPTHGPRAFGGAFGIGLDGIDVFVA